MNIILENIWTQFSSRSFSLFPRSLLPLPTFYVLLWYINKGWKIKLGLCAFTRSNRGARNYTYITQAAGDGVGGGKHWWSCMKERVVAPGHLPEQDAPFHYPVIRFAWFEMCYVFAYQTFSPRRRRPTLAHISFLHPIPPTFLQHCLRCRISICRKWQNQVVGLLMLFLQQTNLDRMGLAKMFS